MLSKTLVSFSTYNAPWFLQTLVESLERYDAKAPFDLLIIDNQSTDRAHLRLLDKYAKRYIVRTKDNAGRAQGGYQYAWQTFREYETYFFLHDDSCIMRDGWLEKGLLRLKDQSLEPGVPKEYEALPVGKVGYCSYEWGTIDRYIRKGHPAIFRFMQPLVQQIELAVPVHFQHIADDRMLYSNACLSAIGNIADIESFRRPNGEPTDIRIHNYFASNFPGRGFIEPKERYHGYDWEGYQTFCEFINDVNPMRCGFRTHNLRGDGYSQEDLGFNAFWGNNDVAHFGAHNVFKRLATVTGTTEESIRKSYTSLNYLKLYASIISDNGIQYSTGRNRNSQQS